MMHFSVDIFVSKKVATHNLQSREYYYLMKPVWKCGMASCVQSDLLTFTCVVWFLIMVKYSQRRCDCAILSFGTKSSGFVWSIVFLFFSFDFERGLLDYSGSWTNPNKWSQPYCCFRKVNHIVFLLTSIRKLKSTIIPLILSRDELRTIVSTFQGTGWRSWKTSCVWLWTHTSDINVHLPRVACPSKNQCTLACVFIVQRFSHLRGPCHLVYEFQYTSLPFNSGSIL
jgi:hypothetical protein